MVRGWINRVLGRFPFVQRAASAVFTSICVNAFIGVWLLTATHPTSTATTIDVDAISIEIIEESSETPQAPPSPPAQQLPQVILSPRPEVPEEAPLENVPPETNEDRTTTGAIAFSEVPLPEEPEPTPEPEPNLAETPGEPDIPAEWTVNREGATLEEWGEFYAPMRPRSGAGDDGASDRLRRVLNEAACADLQLAARLGRNCPPIGAYARYGDVERLAELQDQQRRLFLPDRLVESAPPGQYGFEGMPKAAGEATEYYKQGASAGMVGTLPDPHPHPYSE